MTEMFILGHSSELLSQTEMLLASILLAMDIDLVAPVDTLDIVSCHLSNVG